MLGSRKESWRKFMGDNGDVGEFMDRENAGNVWGVLNSAVAACGRASDKGIHSMMAVAWRTAVIRMASYL